MTLQWLKAMRLPDVGEIVGVPFVDLDPLTLPAINGYGAGAHRTNTLDVDLAFPALPVAPAPNPIPPPPPVLPTLTAGPPPGGVGGFVPIRLRLMNWTLGGVVQGSQDLPRQTVINAGTGAVLTLGILDTRILSAAGGANGTGQLRVRLCNQSIDDYAGGPGDIVVTLTFRCYMLL